MLHSIFYNYLLGWYMQKTYLCIEINFKQTILTQGKKDKISFKRELVSFYW